jgi:hydrogenase maturation protein HypF
MASFPMCPDCEKEYNDPSDRRFHAQPVACPVCGPQVWFERLNVGTLERSKEAIESRKRRFWEMARSSPSKGLGGFHLACDAMNAAGCHELRNRKAARGQAVCADDARHRNCGSIALSVTRNVNC